MIPWWLRLEFWFGLIRVFFVRPRAIWAGVLVPLLVTGAFVCIGGAYDWLSAEARVRVSGAFLQFLGLLVVAEGIRRIRRQLDDRGGWTIIREWLFEVRRAFSRPKRSGIFSGVESGSDSVALSGEVLAIKKPGNLDGRVAELEQEVKQLSKYLDQLKSEIKGEASTRKEADAEERRDRISADERLRKLVEEIEVGGIHLELMGLAWLIAGVMLGTLGPELTSPACHVCALIWPSFIF